MRLKSYNLCRIVAAAAVSVVFGLGADGAVATTAADPGAQAAPISPEGEALKLALSFGTVGGAAEDHYTATGYRRIWLKPGGDDTAAQALIGAVERSGEHGLAPGRYDPAMLRAAVEAAADGDLAAVAAAELRLTAAFLDYAGDLASGVLEPRLVDREIHVFPEEPAAEALLSGAAGASSMEAYLAGLAPRDARYARLMDKLAALRALPADAWGAPAEEGGSLRLGDVSPRVASMRARLIAMGDHAEQGSEAAATAAGAEPPRPDVYDVGLEDSVRAFQRRHGLNDDGVAGGRTIKAMNATIEDRIGQTLVALERLRWMPRELGSRHVYVNQADFTVRLVDAGEIVFQERVVVGQARKHRTPEFSDEMTHMVFNPIWHVPYSIASEEILPKLQEDPEYLLKKNMRLLTRDGGDAPDAVTTDWSLYSRGDFPYLIKQGSGDQNALGRVKFMFPNQFSIYLHDTPSKRLFSKDARAFSHGCVRVQDPMAFARALLAPQTDDPAAFVERMLAKEGERRVNLKEPVPVHLTYLTAWVDEEGVRHFRDDVYGRDRRILAALKAVGIAAPGADG